MPKLHLYIKLISILILILSLIYLLNYLLSLLAIPVDYPDLKTLPPRDLRFDTVEIKGSNHQVLRFTNTVWNKGTGKLVFYGKINSKSQTGIAFQRLNNNDGKRFIEYPV